MTYCIFSKDHAATNMQFLRYAGGRADRQTYGGKVTTVMWQAG